MSTSEATCDDLKRKHETELAQNKKLRAEVSALKVKEETGTAAAASTLSRTLDDASKTAIRTKVCLVRDLQKTSAEQRQVIKNGKALEAKAAKLKAEALDLAMEKSEWTKDKKTMSKLEKKLDEQITAKCAQRAKMA